MVDIAAVAGVMSALRGAQDIAKATLSLRDAALVREKVIELQATILAAQSSASEAHAVQMELLERARELEKQVANLKAWDAEKQRYELRAVAPGAFAYVLKLDEQDAEPAHCICTVCYEHRRKSILQRTTSAHLKCFECDALIPAEGQSPFSRRSAPRDHPPNGVTWRTA